MARYRHVFFDFDGVLCDSLDPAMEVINDLRAEFPALPAVRSQEDMVAVYGGPLATCMSEWLTDEQQRRFFDLHSRAMAGRAATLETFPGVAELLERLPAASASIVTSAYSDPVRRILLANGGGAQLPAVHAIAGRELAQTKTAKIAALLDELSLDAADAVYVGDLESDIIYCREVPIDVVAVSYGYHPAAHLRSCRPDYVVDTVAELAGLLGELVVGEPKPARRLVEATSDLVDLGWHGRRGDLRLDVHR